MICALPRSGSWLLSEALWRSGVAGRPEEYLRPDWRQQFRRAGRLPFQHRLHQQQSWPREPAGLSTGTTANAPEVPDQTIAGFLHEVMSVGTTPNGVFSLKCHWFQLVDLFADAAFVGRPAPEPAGSPVSPPPLDELFPSPACIRLVRQDKVRQAISWHRAISTDAWWSSSSSPRAALPPRYDGERIAHLQRWLTNQQESWDEYFERWGLLPLTVTYRELETSYERTVARVLRRLGLATGQVWIAPPDLRKQADTLTERWARQRAEESERDRAHAEPGTGARTDRGRRPAPHPHRDDIGGSRMRTSMILVDNFYANPRAVRDYALKQRYYHPYQSIAEDEEGRQPHWMASRFKAADACPFKSSSELVARLEEVSADRVDLDHWNLGFPVDATSRPLPRGARGPTTCLWNCCFHLKTGHGSEVSEGVHNHVTDDWNTVGEDGWSGLVYLTDDPPLRGGLQTWRNVRPERDYDWMTPKDQWELVDDLANISNRLVLFRGSVPHSGTPGWGADLEDGRLFQTFFFRVQPRVPSDGVLAPV